MAIAIGVAAASFSRKPVGASRSRDSSVLKARSNSRPVRQRHEVTHMAAKPGIRRLAEAALEGAGSEADAAIRRDFQQHLGRRQGKGAEEALPVRNAARLGGSVGLSAGIHLSGSSHPRYRSEDGGKP